MNALYEDTAFRISRVAEERLLATANQAGLPLARYFRIKAAQLVKIADPKFSLSGSVLVRRLDVGLSGRVLEGLRELCRDLGVPPESAGELVACASFVPRLPA